MERDLAIVGAGLSGLLASKYVKEKCFNPIVFEEESCIGGVWSQTMESTRLQNMKMVYQFSDFPWPEISDLYPTHNQVVEYFDSYAQHFGLDKHIKLNSRVTSIAYVGGESNEEILSWDLWCATGKPFGSRGKWHLTVEDTKSCSIEVYKAEFIILCIGQFSGLPNTPEFPLNQGPEVFNGKVIHSKDYSAMSRKNKTELIKNKRITIVGLHKSGIDIAQECANSNGPEYPCTVIRRTAHWFLPPDYLSGLALGLLFFTRFAELQVHKPSESFLLSILASILSPLRWGASKLVECYLRWKLPMKKYNMIPKCSLYDEISDCQIAMLPNNFYEKVDERSIVLKNPKNFRFYKEGLILDGQEMQPLESDLVIFATGFKGDEKLKSIFESKFFQESIMGSPDSTVPLYRRMIHPRIPRLGIIGYSEGLSTLCTCEVRSQWLAEFLDGKFELPRISEMEKDVSIWKDHMNRHTGKYFRRSCIGSFHIWHNDQLLKDMGLNPRRKNGFLREFLEPYAAADYAGVTSTK